MRYIVVLANEMDASGVLNEESADRADFAGKLALDDPHAKLVTPGWAYRADSSIRIGDSMKERLLDRFNVYERNIVSHLDSKDTVGDAVYCREFFDNMGVSYSIDLVTSDYHCERAVKVFKFIFGDSVAIKSHSVFTKSADSRREAEKISTEAFIGTFSGIAPGDFNAIKERLVQAHPLYAGADI